MINSPIVLGERPLFVSTPNLDTNKKSWVSPAHAVQARLSQPHTLHTHGGMGSKTFFVNALLSHVESRLFDSTSIDARPTSAMSLDDAAQRTPDDIFPILSPEDPAFREDVR